MKKIFLPVIALTIVMLTAGFKIAGREENRPTVQSAFGGTLYVRTIPAADYGDEGKTQVLRVKNDRMSS